MIKLACFFIAFVAPILLFSIVSLKAYAQDEDLSVLTGWMRWSDAPNMLYHHLSNEAFQLLEDRASKVKNLKTEAQWLRRQDEVRNKLMQIVGPFPEKTPLNPKITGIIQKDGYRMEKVIYESMPNFYVTASLFIPDGLKGKTPAILYSSGHTEDGFRSPAYQLVILNLVKKGFIVLAYDPIGQGERLQYFNPEKGRSEIGGSTREHSYAGAQCFISGSSFARYRIWDGIRSVDYLMTRDEIDPERIGMTGRSGGGTLTSYVMAFDDRIKAAAPESYICGFKRLLESAGPQDAEQNFYHGIVNGIDHADLMEVRAPKPCLLISTTLDFFSIQGAMETYEEVKLAYKAFRQEENLQMSVDDAPHQSTKKNREAMYAFFQKHLELPGNPNDEMVEILSPEELKVTETGQVSTSLKNETVFSVNSKETERLIQSFEDSRKNLSQHLKYVKDSAIRLSGYKRPEIPPQSVFTGRYRRDGYSVEKYTIQGEGDYMFPVILMLPDGKEKHPAIIYLRPDGKNIQAIKGGQMESLVKEGFAVIAPDLIGIGETGPGKFKGDAYIGDVSYNVWFESILIGRSIVGLRAGDIVRIVKYLESREDIDFRNISGMAFGEMCPNLLHAAAFDDKISKVTLVEPLISYSSIVMNKYYKPQLIHATVAGALTAYDLPDIAACLAPRELRLIDITDQNMEKAKPELIDKETAIIRSAYSAVGAIEKFKID